MDGAAARGVHDRATKRCPCLEGRGQVFGVSEQLMSARFWFESFQNWQSEFSRLPRWFGCGVLRQQRSPESKAVHAPYAERRDVERDNDGHRKE